MFEVLVIGVSFKLLSKSKAKQGFIAVNVHFVHL